MRTRIMASATTIALSGAMLFGVAPASAAPPTAPPSVSQQQLATTPVVTLTNFPLVDEAGNTVGTFTGTFTLTRFGTSGGDLTVTGLLQGTATSLDGLVTETVNRLVTTTLLDATANQACNILNLDLGPIDLNVLGLRVQLNEVELDITAVPGAGNLLGNLLCSIAGLLDGGINLTGLANLLNRLLGL
jgi:hypothetical protein